MDYHVHVVVFDHHFDFDFGQEVHHILGSTIELAMALLAAIAFDFAHGHTGDAGFAEGLFDIFELERFDNSFNLFHHCSLGII